MVSLPYRAPRRDLSFPLAFRAEGTAVPGHCLNLSESGLLGVFDEALELWTEGEIDLQFGASGCLLHARVARVAEREAGLAFVFRAEAERAAVRLLLAGAERGSQLVGRPPF